MIVHAISQEKQEITRLNAAIEFEIELRRKAEATVSLLSHMGCNISDGTAGTALEEEENPTGRLNVNVPVQTEPCQPSSIDISKLVGSGPSIDISKLVGSGPRRGGGAMDIGDLAASHRDVIEPGTDSLL